MSDSRGPDSDLDWLDMDPFTGDVSDRAYYIAIAVFCGLCGVGLAILVSAAR